MSEPASLYAFCFANDLCLHMSFCTTINFTNMRQD
jgi:hypothetical protein